MSSTHVPEIFWPGGTSSDGPTESSSMKKQFPVLGIFIAATLAFAGGKQTTQRDSPIDIYTANKKLGRGINLGNALEAPEEGAWGVTLKADYFREIKKAGFDTVRLPVNWPAHAKADAPYTIDPKFAERVDWAIDQALTHQLNIVVNVHHYRALDADPDPHVPRLVGLWEQIAVRYKN